MPLEWQTSGGMMEEKIELTKYEIDNISYRLNLIKSKETEALFMKESLHLFFLGILKKYNKKEGEWILKGDCLIPADQPLKAVNE